MVSSLVQAVASDEMRGRVMSVYNVAFRGGMPVGSLLLGKLIPIFSAPVIMGWSGGLLALLGFVLPSGAAARGATIDGASRINGKDWPTDGKRMNTDKKH